MQMRNHQLETHTLVLFIIISVTGLLTITFDPYKFSEIHVNVHFLTLGTHKHGSLPINSKFRYA